MAIERLEGERKGIPLVAKIEMLAVAVAFLMACTVPVTRATITEIPKTATSTPLAAEPTQFPLSTVTARPSLTPTPETKDIGNPEINIYILHVVNEVYLTQFLEEHMVKRGETLISVGDYLLHLNGEKKLPKECNYGVLTFDDGYQNTANAVVASFEAAAKFEGLPPLGPCRQSPKADLFVMFRFDGLRNDLPNLLGEVGLDTPSYRDGNGKLFYMTLREMIEAAKKPGITIRPHVYQNHESSWPVQLENGTLAGELKGMFAATDEIYRKAQVIPPAENVFVPPFGITSDQLVQYLIVEGRKYNAKTAFLSYGLNGSIDPNNLNPNDPGERMRIRRIRP